MGSEVVSAGDNDDLTSHPDAGWATGCVDTPEAGIPRDCPQDFLAAGLPKVCLLYTSDAADE